MHPKTGRVCVPVDVNKCLDFVPADTPTLKTIAEELDNYSGPRDGKDISRTKLQPYIEAYDAFLSKIEKSIGGERARAKANSPLGSGGDLF